MNMWALLAIVCVAGAVGALIHDIQADHRLTLPCAASASRRGGLAIRPGCLTHLLTGAVAAGASWGLYGSGSAVSMAKAGELTPSVLAGAVLIGMGSARWLTAAVAQRIQQETTTPAAQGATERVRTPKLAVVRTGQGQAPRPTQAG